MKIKLLLLCFSMGVFWLAKAQQLDPHVLAAGGASISSAANTARLSFTIGEVAITGQSLSSFSYGQGFHNGAIQWVHTEERAAELDLKARGLKLWPNPVTRTLNLQVTALQKDDFLTASVWDLLGQPLGGVVRLDDFNPKILDLSHLPSGIYLLRLTDPLGKCTAVKFVKAD